MKDDRIAINKLGQQIGLFVIFLVFGFLIFVVFSHIRPILPQNIDLIGRIIMIVGFLAFALLARGSQRFEKYWQTLFACFITSPARLWAAQHQLHRTAALPLGNSVG